MNFLIISLGVPIAAGIILPLWVLFRFDKRARLADDKFAQGSPRSVFHLFSILIYWCALIFLMPFGVNYVLELQRAGDSVSPLLPVFKMLCAPVLLLLIFIYAGRKGFQRWIIEEHWPNNDDRIE